MAARLLLGVLAPMLTGNNNQSRFEGVETSEKGMDDILVPIDIQTPAKFHIGMLSLSLVTGLAFGGFITYKTWMERDIFLGYIRNLIIALVCRTFFSVIFDGVILLGTPLDVAGGNTLLAFERIFLNLVFAFWLTLTIYIHGRVQRNFNSEPTLRLYEYGVPGVAVFFALIWTFTLQDQLSYATWWIFLNPFTQWIVNSLNLLFLFIQLVLAGDIGKMMMKISLDNDSISLFRSISAMMAILILIFWLQFGFDVGRVPLKNSMSYLYFFYFIDGLECALVCLVLYFFSKWVVVLLNKISTLMIGNEEMPRRTSKPSEVLLTGRNDRRIVTVDSVFMTTESRRWNFSEEEGTKDVVYSNVIEPQRLKKTLQLYKRLNIIPVKQVTVVEGEEFYDCQLQNSVESNDCKKSKLPPKKLQTSISHNSKCWNTSSEDAYFKSNKTREQTQKKNAFYSSKYLILDSKESEFPKYLETRPSVSSVSGKDSLKEGQANKDFPSSLDYLMSDELVRKWLIENFENTQKNEKNKTENRQIREEENRETSNRGNLDLQMSKHKLVTEAALKSESAPSQKGDQVSIPRTVVSTIGSVMSSTLFGSNKNERRISEKERIAIPTSDEIKTPAAGEQNAKPLEAVHRLIFETTKSQKEKAVKKSDPSNDITINTNTNAGPRKKGEILINVKEIEKSYSEFQKEDIKTSENLPNELLHNSKSETKVKNPEALKEKLISPIMEQTLNQANKSPLKQENNLGPTVQPPYLDPPLLQAQQDQLIIDQQPQVIEKHVEKLTGFLQEKKDNFSYNDSNFKAENENTCKSLNTENKTQKPESAEPQTYDEKAADKTEGVEVASKPFPEPEPPFWEILIESSVSTDSIREQKPEDTEITPADAKNPVTKDKPTEPLNQYLTYSELLNFRFQRGKETDNQPSEFSKKFFNFSNIISFTVDSLINASGRFLFSKQSLLEKDTYHKAETSGMEKNADESPTNNYRPRQDESDK